MQVIESLQEMQERSLAMRAQGQRIGFVPTMGSLHEGHLSLVDLARKEADVVVASVFVNPAQFGPNEDFERYPRQIEDDLALCRERGVDIVFLPKKAELYPDDFSFFVVEERLSRGLCGISRPKFFRGVCTVVLKLFNIVLPHVSVFGQKDAQQAAIISKMVRDFHLRVEILLGPIIREEDGLAMSSRNQYLTKRQREDAIALYNGLKAAKELYGRGFTSVDRITAEVINRLNAQRNIRVDYVELVNKDTMESLRTVVPGKTLLAAAAWIGEVRMIDNILL